MAIVDGHGLPLAVHVASASPYEPHLVPATLDARFLPDLPARLIGDRGYDSDELRQTLRDNGVEAVIPSRRNRKVQYACDKELYKLRNVIERAFGRMKDWKALSLRTYRCIDTFLSAVCIAATILWWVK